jgi:hypothetical protein
MRPDPDPESDILGAETPGPYDPAPTPTGRFTLFHRDVESTFLETTSEPIRNPDMTRNGRSEARGGLPNVKLETYKPKSKLRAGQFVTVFQADGDVKLLPAKALVPADLPFKGISVLARELVETFDPQYGYGSSPVAGRFALQEYNGDDISYFGWSLGTPDGITTDQRLMFNLFMGQWTGPQPSPVQSFAILAVHVTYTPPAADLAVPPHLSITVNGAETLHQFLGAGTDTVFVNVIKPANLAQVPISLTYRRDQNAGNTSMVINKVERFTSFLFPINDLETLEA